MQMRKLRKHPKIIISHIHRKRHHYLAGIALVGMATILVSAAVGGWKLIDARRIANNPERQAQQTVERVGKLMVLPQDETPAVMTVVDKSKIKNIPFLEHAVQNNDKVLVYSKTKKVVVYRPTDGKIVDVGPVSIAQPPAQQ